MSETMSAFEALKAAQSGGANSLLQKTTMRFETAAPAAKESEPAAPQAEGLADEGSNQVNELPAVEGGEDQDDQVAVEDGDESEDEDLAEIPEHWGIEDKEAVSSITDPAARKAAIEVINSNEKRWDSKLKIAAQERKEAVAIKAEFNAKNEQVLRELDSLAELKAAEVFTDQELFAAFGADPQKYHAAKLENDKKALYLQAIQARKDELIAHKKQELRAQTTAKLEDLAPELLTIDGNQRLAGYLHESYGFTPDELNAVLDYRSLLIAEKARKYDELMKRKEASLREAKGKKAPQVMKPKAQQAETFQQLGQARDIKQAKDRLQKTGSLQDFAQLYKLQRMGKQPN